METIPTLNTDPKHQDIISFLKALRDKNNGQKLNGYPIAHEEFNELCVKLKLPNTFNLTILDGQSVGAKYRMEIIRETAKAPLQYRFFDVDE